MYELYENKLYGIIVYYLYIISIFILVWMRLGQAIIIEILELWNYIYIK